MTFTPVVIGAGLAGFAYLSETKAAQQATLNDTAQNRREAQQVANRLPQVKTADDVLDDRLLLRVALGAFGLDEDINNRAFIKQVLESDLSDSTSLANRLTDKRYLALARTFGFNSPEGPQVPGTAEASALAERLSAVSSAQDLLDDRTLLRATLSNFGLSESDANNRYFLEQVLTSDPLDPSSFANNLGDGRYSEMVAELNFPSVPDGDTLAGFVALAQQNDVSIESADDLLNAPELLDAALDLFGLGSSVPNETFLRDVLESDLNDPDSFANQQNNDLWASFSQAFAIGAKITSPESFVANNTRFDALVEAFTASPDASQSSEEFMGNPQVSVAAIQFFDLPTDSNGFSRAGLVLGSDADDPNALVNLVRDDRYRLLADAVEFRPAETGWVAPPGLAEGIMENYLERQFEIRVGEVDPNMRLALGFERELNELLQNAVSNDARWFGVMASEPLRRVFEGALSLPDSFGSLDLDQQLGEFKARAEQHFGTSDVAQLSSPETVETLLQRFLGSVTISGQSVQTTSSAASVILSTIQTAQF